MDPIGGLMRERSECGGHRGGGGTGSKYKYIYRYEGGINKGTKCVGGDNDLGSPQFPSVE